MAVEFLPDHIGPDSATITQSQMVKVSKSPFSFAEQAIVHTGQQWSADINLPLMGHEDGRRWIAFLSRMGGQAGVFLMGDPMCQEPSGLASRYTTNDYFSVNGAVSAGSSSIAIDGIAPSAEYVFLAGDMVQIGTDTTSRLFMVTDDVTANVSGEATLQLWPDVRTAVADNAQVKFMEPVGLWRLANNSATWENTGSGNYRISFSANSVVL